MKTLTFTRGARFACALTTTLFAAAIWCSAPALAASSFDNKFGASKRINLNSGNPAHAASGSLSGTIVRTIVALVIDRLFFTVQAELFPYRYGGKGILNRIVRAVLHAWEDLRLLLWKAVRGLLGRRTPAGPAEPYTP